MGWSFPWRHRPAAISTPTSTLITEDKTGEGGIEYNYRREPAGSYAAMRGWRAACRGRLSGQRGHDRNRPGHIHAREAGHERGSYSRTVSSTTPIPPMRADWTASGACTSGSTGAPKGRNETGVWWVATTSTTTLERDADARTHMARRGGVVPGMWVGDGRDDAASLVPRLRRYRQAGLGPMDRARGRRLTFAVWTFFGMVAVCCVALAWPRPIAVGVVVFMPACCEFTAWKASHLACCRDARTRGGRLAITRLSLGLHCSSVRPADAIFVGSGSWDCARWR